MMKKKFLVASMALAVAFSALSFSCDSKKTAAATEGDDSTMVSDSTMAELNLADYVGTYEGTLPAADAGGFDVVLTLEADSTYTWTSDVPDEKDSHDEASGVFKILPGNVFMLVRPSTGEKSYYKVKAADQLIMTDSLGNEPEGEMNKLYILTKKK